MDYRARGGIICAFGLKSGGWKVGTGGVLCGHSYPQTDEKARGPSSEVHT